MGKLGATTIASVGLNIVLSLWLLTQYFYDQSFRGYVDTTLGPVYPFIVLIVGLGGGSSLGYLLLKRRHGGDGSGRLERPRLFRPAGTVLSPGSLSSSSQGKMMPRGPPPSQVSRHTAYSVPPLLKSPNPTGGTRSVSPPSISVPSKIAPPPPPPASTSQRLEQRAQPSTAVLNSTLRDQFRPEPAPMPSSPPPSLPVRDENTQPMPRISPEPSRMSIPSQWRSEPGQSAERGAQPTGSPRPSQVDVRPEAESPGFGPAVGEVPRPPQPSQTPFPVSKWVPPEQRAGAQWTDPVPKPGLAAPQKWAPPPGQGFPPRPPPQGVPPRPGPGPVPGGPVPRPPFPAGQGGPRPLGYPNPARPGQPGPIGVSPPFRSDQPRPTGPPPQGRPMPPGGPVPQQWSPPKPAERVEASGPVPSRDVSEPPPFRPNQSGASEGQRQVENRSAEPSSTGGEMDWDTALDTILKTLKKDRGVGERT